MKINKNIFLHLAFLQALIASLLSLFFSEIVKIPVCNLCWYQRIFMYPIAIILTIAILKKDKQIGDYVLPLSIFGLIFALYQNLIYYQIINQNLLFCSTGLSCTEKTFELFNFISIPLLSLVAFIVIIVSMLIYRKTEKN